MRSPSPKTEPQESAAAPGTAPDVLATQERDEAWRSFRFTATFVSVILAVTLMMSYAIPTHSPTRAIWPQRWTFFDDDLRGSNVVAYDYNGWDGAGLLNERQATIENIWGLRRIPYIQGLEMQRILAEIPVEAWSRCTAGASCLESIVSSPPVDVVNGMSNPTYCGRILLLREDLRTRRPVDRAMPGVADQGILVEVTCPLAGS